MAEQGAALLVTHYIDEAKVCTIDAHSAAAAAPC